MSLSVCSYWATVSRNLHCFGSFADISQKFSVAKDVTCGLVIKQYHSAKIVSWCGVCVECEWILRCTHTFITGFFVVTLVDVGELDRFIFKRFFFFPYLGSTFLFFLTCVSSLSMIGLVVVADWFLFPLSGSLRFFRVPLLIESHSWGFS